MATFFGGGVDADDIIAEITDSAPQTLDTLNELAAALNDDANFASTVTTALSNKQDKVSNVSDTELGYLDGVTSAIQTQINGKANSSHTHAIADTTGLQTALDGKAATSHSHDGSAITYTINDKSANYTIVASDEGKFIRSTGSAITVTVADVFSIGEVVTFTQYGAGQVTFAPAGGVTLHSVDSKRKTNKQYSTVQIMKTAASTYLLFGDIVA
jgi:hypothetical protein